jgi:hypothetical protein
MSAYPTLFFFVANHCLEVRSSVGPVKDQCLINLMDHFEVQFERDGAQGMTDKQGIPYGRGGWEPSHVCH